MRRLILVLGLVTALGFAPAPFPKPDTSKEDLEALQGHWRCVRIVVQGQTRYEGPGFHVMEFTNHSVHWGGEWYGITLNTTKRLKALDFEGTFKSFEFCYHLDGETLLLCRGDDRPTDFNASKRGRILYVYKRKSGPGPQL